MFSFIFINWAHPIKGRDYEAEDLDNASGLDLGQPQGVS